MMKKEEPVRIGIALSGGGARGIAHIGVLQALEEQGISPAVLSGTSAGAIAGALYASGKTPAEMLEFVKDASILKVFKVSFPYSGLARLTYLRERLSAFIPEDRFEALQKKLFITVSNLNTGEPEIIQEGALFRAIMASSAIPLVFQPIEIDGNLYVDGGLLENLPVRPLVYEGLDIIIGVNVMPLVDAPSKSIQSVVGIASRCFDLSIQGNTRPNVEFCDVFIEPKNVHKYNIFQFNKYRQLYEIGYQAALDKIADIQQEIDDAVERRKAKGD
jgi:NTE family protein